MIARLYYNKYLYDLYMSQSFCEIIDENLIPESLQDNFYIDAFAKCQFCS